MSGFYEFHGETVTKTPHGAAFAARALRAAGRRAQAARIVADRYPSPDNNERAAELEAGLARMEGKVTA
jgi:hypothetical protein